MKALGLALTALGLAVAVDKYMDRYLMDKMFGKPKRHYI